MHLHALDSTQIILTPMQSETQCQQSYMVGKLVQFTLQARKSLDHLVSRNGLPHAFRKKAKL